MRDASPTTPVGDRYTSREDPSLTVTVTRVWTGGDDNPPRVWLEWISFDGERVGAQLALDELHRVYRPADTAAVRAEDAGEAEQLRQFASRIRAARALHRIHQDSAHCQLDGEPWPCATAEALDSPASADAPESVVLTDDVLRQQLALALARADRTGALGAPEERAHEYLPEADAVLPVVDSLREALAVVTGQCRKAEADAQQARASAAAAVRRALEDAKALHEYCPGSACGTCADEDGQAASWPCETWIALEAMEAATEQPTAPAATDEETNR